MSPVTKTVAANNSRNWSWAILLTFAALAVGVATLLQTNILRDSLLAQTSSFSDYPTLQGNQGLTDPSLAYGLKGVSDWTAQMPFLNLIKMSRSWIGHRDGQWGGYDEEDLRAGGHLNAQGWPTSIPSDATQLVLLWDWSGAEYGAAESRAGDYVMLYEGSGTFVLNGVQNEQRSGDQVTFSLDGDNLWSVGITATDSQDPLRNFVVVKEEYLPLYEAGAIFNPDFLAVVEDARQVRFMDWTETNNSTEEGWSDRPEPENYTWSDGVPIEIMVRLANEIGADPWFTVPFHANDNYAQQYAMYVRDNLDPELIATVEYSNEVWNWSFEQAQEAGELAEQEFNQTGGAGWVNYYGKRASEIMAIWTNVFGAETSGRLNRTAGVHTGYSALTDEILEAPMWQAADPDNYVAPHTYFDSIAGTTYFGGSAVSDENVRNALFAAIDDPGVNAYDWHETLLRGNNPNFPDEGIPNTVANWQELRTYTEQYDLGLIAYEGGQHVHHSAFIDIPQSELDRLQEHLTGFVRSQQMADLYQTLWDEWQLVSDGPFMQFVDVSRPTQSGSWGLRASLNDSTPRSVLLEQLNTTTPAWWEDRGGSRFQHGVTEVAATTNATVVGSAKVDVLAGNDTNNIMYAGPGDDYLNGAGGEDTALFTGNRSEYTVTASGDAYMVTGPDGQDRIVNIEVLQFADQAVTPEGVVVDGPAPEPNPTPSVTLAASPETITVGESSTLTWSSSNATSCNASGSWSGGQDLNGTATVSPTADATYTLTCTGAGGSHNVSVSVTVEEAATDPQPTSGARTASPFDVAQVHSGHSLTDAAVFQGGEWPYNFYELMINHVAGDEVADVWKSTIPGSPMSWRRENVSSPSSEDAWTNIASRELLVITENNLVAPASMFPSGWEADMRQKRRDEFTTWVERAATIGNGGAGTEVILYTNWPAHDDYAPASNWRARLAANEVEWMAVADQAVNQVSGVEEIYIVPGNELMMQLWDDAEAGLIPGLSSGAEFHASSRWWSDDVHPTGLGTLALGYLTLGVVHQVDPRTVSATGWGLSLEPTAAEATYIQNLIWDILNSYERTGFSSGGSEPTPDPTPEPTLSLSADTTSITEGDSITVSWSTENADSCTASNGWSGSRSTSGSEAQSPTTDTSYTLTCTGDGGEVSNSIAVTVAAAPEPEPDPAPEPDNVDPVAVNDAYTVNADVTTDGMNVLANDTDADNDQLTLVAVSDNEGRVGTRQSGSNGGAFLFTRGGSLTFDPDGDFNSLLVGESRQTTITYTVADSSDARDTAVVTVTVTGTAIANRAPVANDDSFTTDADTVLDSVNVLTNDTDADGDTLTVFTVDGSSSAVGSVQRGSNGGNFTIASDGALSFDPADDFDDLRRNQSETTAVNYTVRDAENAAATATASVIVSGTQVPSSTNPPARTYDFQNRIEMEVSNPRINNAPNRLRVAATEQCDVTRFATPDMDAYRADDNRNYPVGMFETEVTCVDTGKTITQEIVLDQEYNTTGWELRKYDADTETYTTINPAAVTYTVDNEVTVVQYELTDGGALDSDGEANGVIVDPVGIAVPTTSEPEEEDTTTSGSGGSSSSGGGSSSSSSGGSSVASRSSDAGSATTESDASAATAPDNERWNGFAFRNNISFIRKSDNDPADVRKLQEFLNTFAGENLTVDGTYDEDDLEAVRRFQEAHRREILDIWNLQTATGFVGITTRLKMNAMLQGETTQCPLFQEYNGGRSGVMSSPEVGETQRLLRDLDMYDGPINNRWDAATNQALISFQETFHEVMLDPWNIGEGTGYKYKTTNKFLNYLVGCTTGAVHLEGVGTYGAY